MGYLQDNLYLKRLFMGFIYMEQYGKLQKTRGKTGKEVRILSDAKVV